MLSSAILQSTEAAHTDDRIWSDLWSSRRQGFPFCREVCKIAKCQNSLHVFCKLRFLSIDWQFCPRLWTLHSGVNSLFPRFKMCFRCRYLAEVGVIFLITELFLFLFFVRTTHLRKPTDFHCKLDRVSVCCRCCCRFRHRLSFSSSALSFTDHVLLVVVSMLSELEGSWESG